MSTKIVRQRLPAADNLQRNQKFSNTAISKVAVSFLFLNNVTN